MNEFIERQVISPWVSGWRSRHVQEPEEDRSLIAIGAIINALMEQLDALPEASNGAQGRTSMTTKPKTPQSTGAKAASPRTMQL